MVILIFGVILPNLIEERNLSFTAAGGLLSFLAIGNLCSTWYIRYSVDDVPEDGGSRTGGPLSGVPLPVYNGTSGPGALM